MAEQKALTVRDIVARPVVYQGHRVLTLAAMDAVHQRSPGTAKRNFHQQREKGRLTDGRHYFEVPYVEWCQWDTESTNFVLSAQGGHGFKGSLTVLTEKGYLLLVKSFQDDLAWQVQEELVEGYFRLVEKTPASQAEMLLLWAQQLVDQERRLAAVEGLGQEVQETRQVADAALARAECNHGHYSVLGYARLHGWELTLPAAARHGKALTRICAGLGVAIGKVRDPRFGEVNTYPETVLDGYFEERGEK